MIPARSVSRLLPRLALALLVAAMPMAAMAADLLVSAAASLTSAFRTLGPAFEAHNPGTKVVFNFAGSDALLAQIVQGAPVDVFAAADAATVDRAEKHKLLLPGTRTDFARNTLVLVAPASGTLAARSIADLSRAPVKRIAMGSPASVPAGRYAREALEVAGLWPVLEARMVFAQNVRQVVDYVARGEVDAGLVYATDAALIPDRVRVLASVPTRTPVTYPIAAVAGSRNPAAARRFIAFVLSPDGQAVLARFGFGRP
jgi:molybdate transport system substrate-binding protein